MRQGRVFRRCTRCRTAVTGRTCGRCGNDRATWYYVVDVAGGRGARSQRSKGGFPTRREAQAAMNEVLAALATDSYVGQVDLNLGAYLEEWLPVAQARLRPSAYAVAELHVRRYIAPRIGGIRLQDVRPTTVKAFYGELRRDGRIRGAGGGLSPKMIHNIHRTLSRALRDAVDDRLIVRNPAERAHKQPESPEMPTWNPDELRAFLDGLAGDRLEGLWRVAAMTGLRRGELAGLRWRDVDLDAGRLSVVQQLAKGQVGYAVGPPKSRRSRRQLALDAGTTAALKAHRKQQLEERLLLGSAYDDQDYVFCRIDGHPLHPDRLTQIFETLVARSGLPRLTLHGLRHTHATLMLRAGIHPKVVQERMGHSSIAITLDTYSHAIPAMQEDAADRVAALVDGIDTEVVSHG